MKTVAGILALTLTLPAPAENVDIENAGPGRLPAWIIEVPATVNDVFVADTSNATMHRFSRDDAAFTWRDSRYMSIGQSGIRKQRAWDKKTPLGSYFVTERLDTSRMHDKYGAAAFPLDYPNAWDRFNNRTGYGIWLHGVDKNNPDRPPLDTDGCLALPNNELIQIAEHLLPLVTPVIVTAGLEWASAAELEATRLSLRRALNRWRQSMSDGDLVSYLSMYSDDFRHYDMDKPVWSTYRLQVFEQRGVKETRIENLLLLAEPADSNTFLSRFTQVMTTANGTVTTTKRLYWRRDSEDDWLIVSEDSG